MGDKLWVLLGVCIVVIGIVSGVQESMKAEYARGYKAGVGSLTPKQVDDMCVQWLFQSDLTAAKKRICGK